MNLLRPMVFGLVLLAGCVDKAERCEQLYTDNLTYDLNVRHARDSNTENTAEPLSPREVKWYEANCWDGKPRTR